MTTIPDIVRTDVLPGFSPVLFVHADTRIYQIDIVEFDKDRQVCGELDVRVPIDFLRGLRDAYECEEAWSHTYGHSITPIDDKVEILLAGRRCGGIHITVARDSICWLAGNFEYALSHMSEIITCGGEGYPIELTAHWE